MRRPFVLFVAVIILTVLLGACTAPTSNRSAAGTAQPSSGGKLVAIATTAIIADLARNVAGDRTEVKTLLPPNTDPHTYQPTPRDVAQVTGADVVFMNGLGLDAFVEPLLRSAGTPGKAKTIVVSAGLKPIDEEEHEPAVPAKPGAKHEEHAAGNPHLWLDVRNAIHYVERIRDGLVEVDPAGADTYRKRADEYVGRLRGLDQSIEDQIKTIPEPRRKLVTFHDAFPYYARRYGLRIVGIVLKSPGREPSAREVVELVTTIRREQVPAVFTEPQFNARILELAARDASVKVVELYSDAFQGTVDSYESLMRVNTERIVGALK